jgi:branched-chain amino acid transport system permease protein
VAKVVEELESRSLLACFGLMFIIQNVVAAVFTGNVKIVSWGNEPVPIGGYLFGLNMIVAAVLSIIISVLMYLLLRFTRVGLAMRATVEEPAGAQLVGIDTLKIHAVSFGLGALLAAVAGSMLITMYNFTPYLPGPWYTSFALAVIILGGMGSFIGSMLGGFFVGYIYYFSLSINGLIAVPVVYICIILLLLVKPKGFFGR